MISKGVLDIRGKGLYVFWSSYFSLVTIQLPSVTARSNDFEFSPGPVDLGLGMSWIVLVGEIFLERRVLWVHWFREASQVAWTIRDFRWTADFFPCWSVSKDPLKVEMVVTRWPVMCFALQSPVFLDTCHKYLVGGFILFIFHFIYGMSSFPLTLTSSFFKMVSVPNQVLSPKKVVFGKDMWRDVLLGIHGVSFIQNGEAETIPWGKSHDLLRSTLKNRNQEKIKQGNSTIFVVFSFLSSISINYWPTLFRWTATKQKHLLPGCAKVHWIFAAVSPSGLANWGTLNVLQTLPQVGPHKAP